MASPDNGTSTRDVIIAVLVLVGTVAGVVANLRIGSLNNKVNEQRVNLDVQKFQQDAAAREQDLELRYITKLLSDNPKDQEEATAALVTAYPNDAQRVIDEVRKVTSTPQVAAGLAQASNKANQVAQAVGLWGVVVGSDTSLAAANDEVQHVKEQGLSPTVFLRQGYYATVATGFPDQQTAEAEAITLRAKIRSSSFVVNINSWCPGSTSKEGFTQC
jgi:hypothetical protein